MSLIGYGELVTGETPEDCADRWRVFYGIDRGMTLAEVIAKTSSRPIAAYYRKVAEVLGQFSAPRQSQRHLREAPVRRLSVIQSSAEKYAKQSVVKGKRR